MATTVCRVACALCKPTRHTVQGPSYDFSQTSTQKLSPLVVGRTIRGLRADTLHHAGPNCALIPCPPVKSGPDTFQVILSILLLCVESPSDD